MPTLHLPNHINQPDLANLAANAESFALAQRQQLNAFIMATAAQILTKLVNDDDEPQTVATKCDKAAFSARQLAVSLGLLVPKNHDQENQSKSP